MSVYKFVRNRRLHNGDISQTKSDVDARCLVLSELELESEFVYYGVICMDTEFTARPVRLLLVFCGYSVDWLRVRSRHAIDECRPHQRHSHRLQR
jgi:hypothetical protein